MKTYKSESDNIPKEWDITSSKIVVYNNYNIEQVKRIDNINNEEGEPRIVYTYDVNEYTKEEYKMYMIEKNQQDILQLDNIIKQNILLSIDIDYEKSIEEIKQLAIAKTNAWLEKELEKGLEFNGKIYNVTKIKQNLLSAQLGLHALNLQFDIPSQLTWNESGKPCEDWELSDLLILSNAIRAHVSPIQKKQQDAEVMIKESNDIEQIKEIMLDFE